MTTAQEKALVALVHATALRTRKIFAEVVQLRDALLEYPGNRERYAVRFGEARFQEMQDELDQVLDGLAQLKREVDRQA